MMFKFSKLNSNLYVLNFSGPLSEKEQKDFLNFLDELSEVTVPYVALLISDGDSPLSTENKKRMNMWFKNNKDQLATQCFGHVRVQSGFTADHYEHSNLAKALPFPLRAASTYTEGLKMARELLAEAENSADRT